MLEILQKIEFYLTFFAFALTGSISSCLGPSPDPYEKVDFTGLSVEQIEEKHGEFDIKYCTRSDSEPSPAPVKITEASYICDEDHRDSFGDYLGIYIHTVYFDENGLAESSKGNVVQEEYIRYKTVQIDENHSPGYYTKEEVKKIYSENSTVFERAKNVKSDYSGLLDLTSLNDSDIDHFSESDRCVLQELFALKPYRVYFDRTKLSHISFMSAEGSDCSILVFCGNGQDGGFDEMRRLISEEVYTCVYNTVYAECIGSDTILCHNEPYGRVPGEHFDPDTFLNCTPEYLSSKYRYLNDPYGKKLGVWKSDGTKRPSVQVYQKAFFHGETDDTSVDSKYEDVYVIYFDENGISYDYKVEKREKPN